MKLQINYVITGLGWAQCQVEDEQSLCTVTASYLGDALGNMLLAACAALRFFERISFPFEEEPGEYRWVLRAPRPNEIELRIFEFMESHGSKPEAEGKLLFSTTCLPVTFAHAVHEAASKLLAELGEAGYLEKWSEHPFPTHLFHELTRLLEIEKREPAQ